MRSPVVNAHRVEGFPSGPEGGSERFGTKKVAPVGPSLGLTKLGLMVTVVEPGKRAFPFHNHLGNDEAFVILEGTGTYRFGPEEYPVKRGDICGAPRGGQDRAHQLVNAGTEDLVYVGISSMDDPEVVEYPDSGKFAAIAVAPGKDFMTAHMRHVGKPGDAYDYWDGEDT